MVTDLFPINFIALAWVFHLIISDTVMNDKNGNCFTDES